MRGITRIAGVPVVLLICSATVDAEFPMIRRGDLGQNDDRLSGPIEKSKAGEVTIASFNVRNWGARRRGFRDYEAIIDVVDEADVILFQEVALGVFDTDEDSTYYVSDHRAIWAQFRVTD